MHRKNLYLIHDSHSPFCREMRVLPQVRCHYPPIWPPALPLNLTSWLVSSKLSSWKLPYHFIPQSESHIHIPSLGSFIQKSSQVCDSFRILVLIIFYGKGLLAQPPSWRTTPCHFPPAACSIYSQLPSIAGGRSSIRNPRTHHAVVTVIHLTWLSVIFHKNYKIIDFLILIMWSLQYVHK
jgi:hypothetical protein